MIQQIVPEMTTVTIAALAERMTKRGSTPDKLSQDFCATLSQYLLQDQRARPFPDLQALGFWLRPANITAMLRDHLTAPPHCHRTPLGTVFMIPPANVDGLFGYSLAIGLLSGNNVLLRLPSQTTPAQEVLLGLISDALRLHPTLHNRLALLRYGHDAEITEQLSALCQLRLVWGGDDTVAQIAQIPLPPLAQQIGFGDRFSAAVINGEAYQRADTAARDELAKQFANDLYWYDQQACASPRLLCWIGACDRDDFYHRLAAQAEARGYQPDTGASVAKITMEYLALHDLVATAYHRISPALTVITTEDEEAITKFKRVNYGHGLLIATSCATLEELAALATPHDQTLTHWGFPPESIAAFSAKGYDRIIPIGQALQFDPVWDGHNLFSRMTRLVRVIA